MIYLFKYPTTCCGWMITISTSFEYSEIFFLIIEIPYNLLLLGASFEVKKLTKIKELLKILNKLKHNEISKIINQRIKSFKNLNKKSNEEWFSEICFCLLTANWKAKESIEIQKELGVNGFFELSHQTLADFLKMKGHRFWSQRAERICLVRKYINIKDILLNQKEPREWLVKNIKGIGYKESSHFLRNVGYDNFAILDRHIIRIMYEYDLIKEIPKSLTKKRYLELEDKLKELAILSNLNLAELDLYLWYMETGKVLK